jgi:Tfp pilus assembly protein PilZ
MYQRSALVLDEDGGALSGLSLSLISLGLSPLYSSDLDELVLLSREYRQQVGAILVPADRIQQRLRALVARIVEPLGLSAMAVVPVGTPLARGALDALADHGLRWALWQPFEAPDLRFVVAQVLSNTDPEELRLHARIPCSLPAQVESPLGRAALVLTDLSMGGCFARLAEPFSSGARIRLRCELAGQRVSIRGRVAWNTGAGAPDWHDAGMGIEFLEMDDDARVLLTRHIDERLGRYRVKLSSGAGRTRLPIGSNSPGSA